MELEEMIKQLEIMLDCRKKQREEFKECVNCDADIEALEITIKILKKQKEIIDIIKED